MLVNTKMKCVNLNKTTLNKEVSSWTEQDIIVPDTKPDAIKIVNVTVTPYVNMFEVMDSKIKVSGKLNYFIIYRVNDEKFNTRGLYVSFPYTEILNVDNISSNMEITVEPYCKNVIYSLPNERKISVKSEICFKIHAKEKIDINLIKEFDTEDNIEIKTCEKMFQNIIQNKNSIIASKEDVMLPKEAEDFFELLKVETKIINTDYKDSYNKVMVKGDILTKLIYLSDSNNENIKTVVLTIPFSAMVELDNISDRSKFDIKYIMQDFNIKLNPDITSTKTMSAEYQIDVDVTMYEEDEIEYIDDFYSQNKNLEYDVDTVEVVAKNMNLTENIDIKENISNILSQNTVILDYDIDTNYIVPKITNNMVELEGNAKISMLIQNLDNYEIDNKVIDILINEKYDVSNVDKDSNIYIEVMGENINITQSGTDIEVKLTLAVKTNIETIANMNLIEKIEDMNLDTSNLDSINLYIVKQGDSLWKIAKKYKTSVDKIVKTNNIENPDVIDVGQKILIIR